MTLKLNRSTFGDPKNSGNLLTKEEAFQLLTDWVKNERLQTHMKQVAHLMKCWAKQTLHLEEKEQWK